MGILLHVKAGLGNNKYGIYSAIEELLHYVTFTLQTVVHFG